MAKIAICEDSYVDISRRYKWLASSEHDISIYYFDTDSLEYVRNVVEEMGFNLLNFHAFGKYDFYDGNGLDIVNDISKADIIFSDGLRSGCIFIHQNLSDKSNFYIFSNDSRYLLEIMHGGSNVVVTDENRVYLETDAKIAGVTLIKDKIFSPKQLEEIVSKLDK
jgi:hypothetical protein